MDGDATTLRVRAAATLVIVVSVACTILIGRHVGGVRVTDYVDDLATALAALAATVMCTRTMRRQHGRLRLFWLLLAAASGAWTLAETLWAVYDLVLNEAVPVPSWADVGYLTAIPLTVAALLVHPAMRQSAVQRARATIDGLVVATAISFLSWTFVLGPLWRHTDLTTLGGVVAVAYPFGDIIMLVLVVLIVRALQPPGRAALWFVLLAIVAMAISDSTYTYLSEIKSYTTGDLIDVGWIVAYLRSRLGRLCRDHDGAALASSGAGSRTLVAVARRPLRRRSPGAGHDRDRDPARAPPRPCRVVHGLGSRAPRPRPPRIARGRQHPG